MDVEKISSRPLNFFVTGLPRSRTAWFSEYLPNCLHEGMEGCYTHADYIEKLGDSGDSSSMLMYFPIAAYYPKSPVVIVDRDIDDVAFSLEKIGLFNDEVMAMLKDAKKRMNKMKGLRVDFNNLPIKVIWEYLIGTQFDELRAKKMNEQNIQKVNYTPDMQAMISLLEGA